MYQRRDSPMTTEKIEKGPGLARGPALGLGSVLLVAGLYFLYRDHSFPALAGFPSASVKPEHNVFLGIFGANGWSAELTAVAGGVLLIGAAQHLLAKGASLIVAVVLAGVAIIALFHHHSALGLFGANVWLIVLWAGSAVLLLFNSLVPRPTRVVEPAYAPATAAGVARPVAPVQGSRAVRPVEPAAAEPAPAATKAPAKL